MDIFTSLLRNCDKYFCYCNFSKVEFLYLFLLTPPWFNPPSYFPPPPTNLTPPNLTPTPTNLTPPPPREFIFDWLKFTRTWVSEFNYYTGYYFTYALWCGRGFNQWGGAKRKQPHTIFFMLARVTEHLEYIQNIYNFQVSWVAELTYWHTLR